MSGRNSTLTTPVRVRSFALASVLAHGIVLGSWQTSPWTLGQMNNVLSVTLVSEHTNAASAEVQTHQLPRKIESHIANADEQSTETLRSSDRLMALLATSTQTSTHSVRQETDFSKDTSQNNVQAMQNPALPSARASGEEDQHDQAKSQIKARLKTDLARYFDYPYAARLRGWEGTVLLAFNIETNGRLEGIHVAQSSGYAVLDNSALDALRKVQRLVETTAWLQNRELNMQIPVIYRLRCADTSGCSGNP